MGEHVWPSRRWAWSPPAGRSLWSQQLLSAAGEGGHQEVGHKCVSLAALEEGGRGEVNTGLEIIVALPRGVESMGRGPSRTSRGEVNIY